MGTEGGRGEILLGCKEFQNLEGILGTLCPGWPLPRRLAEAPHPGGQALRAVLFSVMTSWLCPFLCKLHPPLVVEHSRPLLMSGENSRVLLLALHGAIQLVHPPAAPALHEGLGRFKCGWRLLAYLSFPHVVLYITQAPSGESGQKQQPFTACPLAFYENRR